MQWRRISLIRPAKSQPWRVFKHACATPLSTLQVCAVLGQQLQTTAEYQRLFEQVATASQRLGALVMQLHDWTASRERFSLTIAIREILPLFDYPLVSVQLFATDKKTQFIYGNKLQIQEILVCLINNAIESYQRHEQKFVNIGIKASNGEICLIVSDYGRGWQKGLSGVPKSTKVAGGTGLRFVLDEVAHSLRGTVTIQTQPTMGTRVLLKFPQYQQKRSQSRARF